jgi:bifunctional UDP-N-acetylglucosamine pyrophosphorylase/glucosamine-1-phosphate N-acetyltransferase
MRVDFARSRAYNAIMADKIKAVVLAAGKSTRMRSGRSKVLHRILGKEIIHYLLDSLLECGLKEEDIVVVAGDNRAELESVIGSRFRFAVQKEPLGTAHALLSASALLAGYKGDLLVLVGDNPYVTAAELNRLISRHRESRAQCTFISALFPGDPPPYGRVVRGPHGQVRRIVEEKDASPAEQRIREVNASIYLFDNMAVFPNLARIGNHNAKGEYYLTDIIEIMLREKLKVEVVQAADCDIAIGINDRRDLQEAQRKFNFLIQQRLMLEGGVTILQAETVTIEHDVEIGCDTVIYPCTYLAAGTRIGRDCSIGPFAFLKNVRVLDHEKVVFEKREA